MDYKYCSRCKKMYTIGNRNLCAECIRTLDDYMRTIRDFLDENPHANINMVSEGTDIEERDILHLLRTERLELNTESMGFCCDLCGAPIKKGRYCEECKKNMSNSFDNVARGMREKKNQGQNDDSKYNGRTTEESKRGTAQKMQVLDKYRNR